MYDVILKGGFLYSPEDSLNEIGDIAISNGKIAKIGGEIEAIGDVKVINVKGLHVSPGFIDLHIHGYAYNTDYGTFPDYVGIKGGVTTVVDQGSCGALTFPGFKHFMVETSKSRVLCFINIGAAGTLKGSMLPPLHAPEGIDLELTIDTIMNNKDIIKGIKTHAEMGGYSRWGLEVLRRAKKVSKLTGVPLYVHTGLLFPADEAQFPHPDVVLPEAVQLLEEGDMLTHCFTKNKGGILSTNGQIHPEVLDALERGILLDVGYGEHFSYTSAEKVLDQGVRPHIISSDVHAPFGSPHSIDVEYGLNEAMSRMFPLGYTLEELIKMVTSRPANILKMENEIGYLKEGREADLTIFELEQGQFNYRDTEGRTMVSDKRLFSKLCVKSGEVFDLRKEDIVVSGV